MIELKFVRERNPIRSIIQAATYSCIALLIEDQAKIEPLVFRFHQKTGI